MKKSKNFFKTIPLTFYPKLYYDLTERDFKNCAKYFFSFLFLGFILLVLFMLPQMSAFSNSLAGEFSKFDTLNINIEHKMNDAALITPNRPILKIDTRSAEMNMSTEKFLITSDYIYKKNYKAPFSQKIERMDIAQYKNLLDNKEMISNFLTMLFLLLLPSLLVVGYLVMTLKYILVILVASGIAFVLSRIFRFEILFREIVKVAIFATTPLIILDIIQMGFGLHFYKLQYLVYAIFFVMGILEAGDFGQKVTSKRKKQRRRDFVELKDSF